MRVRIVRVLRDAMSGRFTSRRQARRWPYTTIVEIYRLSVRKVRGRRVKRPPCGSRR